MIRSTTVQFESQTSVKSNSTEPESYEESKIKIYQNANNKVLAISMVKWHEILNCQKIYEPSEKCRVAQFLKLTSENC